MLQATGFRRRAIVVSLVQEGTLLAAAAIARRKLPFVYLGNVLLDGASDTHCPACGALAVRRTGYRTENRLLPGGLHLGQGRLPVAPQEGRRPGRLLSWPR